MRLVDVNWLPARSFIKSICRGPRDLFAFAISGWLREKAFTQQVLQRATVTAVMAAKLLRFVAPFDVFFNTDVVVWEGSKAEKDVG